MEVEFMTADTALPPCMPLPRAMLRLPISSTAKVMYARMLDIIFLSGIEDANGILFIHFPIVELAAALARSTMTVKRSLNELEDAGLILRVRQGFGEPNKIYVRYADDFLIAVNGSKQDCEWIKAKLTEFIQNTLKMELSQEKTLITHSNTPARFLGYAQQLYEKKLLTYPRTDSQYLTDDMRPTAESLGADGYIRSVPSRAAGAPRGFPSLG